MVADNPVDEKGYILSVVCETQGCANQGRAINIIRGIEPEYAEAFIEDWSGTNGAEPEDFCPACRQRGVLQDPEPQKPLFRFQ